jgi:hypothetical protein
MHTETHVDLNAMSLIVLIVALCLLASCFWRYVPPKRPLTVANYATLQPTSKYPVVYY